MCVYKYYNTVLEERCRKILNISFSLNVLLLGSLVCSFTSMSLSLTLNSQPVVLWIQCTATDPV